MKKRNLILGLSLTLSVVFSAAASCDRKTFCELNPDDPTCQPEPDFEGFYISDQLGGLNLELTTEPIVLRPSESKTLVASPNVEGQVPSVTWNTSNSDVVSVSTSGVVTYVGDGIASVTAVDSRVSRVATINFKGVSIDENLLDTKLESLADWALQSLEMDDEGYFTQNNATYTFHNPETKKDYMVVKHANEGIEFSYPGWHADHMNYIRTGYLGRYAFWGRPTNAAGDTFTSGSPKLSKTKYGNGDLSTMMWEADPEESAEGNYDAFILITSAYGPLFSRGEFQRTSGPNPVLTDYAKGLRDNYTIKENGNLVFNLAGKTNTIAADSRQYAWSGLSTWFASLLYTFWANAIGKFEVEFDANGDPSRVHIYETPFVSGVGVPDFFTDAELEYMGYVTISDVGTSQILQTAVTAGENINSLSKWNGLASHPVWG